MKKIFDLIISYKFSIIYILFYEFIFIILGYKGNSFVVRKNNKATDTIPCSYYFLVKIYNVIKHENINSFIDLGCGNGRVIYFLNKKLKINYTGVELFNNSYEYCSKIFKMLPNIKLLNKNFFDLDYNNLQYDCYFLNDPLHNLEDHNKLIKKIISSFKPSKKALFITVNLTEGKDDVFKSMELLYSLIIYSRSIKIYKYN